MLGFLPWIIFWVVASPSTWEYAALAALIASVVLAIPAAEHHRLKIADWMGIAFFGVLALLALFLDVSDLDWLEDHSQSISTLALAAIVLASLAFDPFTAPYARETVPQQYWQSENFRKINRTLTTVWGLVFLVIGISGLIAEGSDSSDTQAVFNWIVPVAALVAAIKLTQWYPDHVTGPDDGTSEAPHEPD